LNEPAIEALNQTKIDFLTLWKSKFIADYFTQSQSLPTPAICPYHTSRTLLDKRSKTFGLPP
jgi:hypothetical protein